MKSFLAKHATTIGILGSLAGTLWAAFETLLQSSQPLTVASVATVLMPALMGFLIKRPWDVTKAKAHELAEERATEAASEALRRVSMHPGPRNGD
ncbi:MAG TPA: hypothetical protein VFZ61_28020 [Polyangiales bacterium]